MSPVTAFLYIKFYRTRTLLSKSLSAQRAKESLAGTACTDTDMGCYSVLRVSRRFHAMVPLGVCVDGRSKGWKRLDDEEPGVLSEFRFHPMELGNQRCLSHRDMVTWNRERLR